MQHLLPPRRSFRAFLVAGFVGCQGGGTPGEAGEPLEAMRGTQNRGSPAFLAWIAAIEATTELRPEGTIGGSPVRCEAGAALSAWREAPGLEPPMGLLVKTDPAADAARPAETPTEISPGSAHQN